VNRTVRFAVTVSVLLLFALMCVAMSGCSAVQNDHPYLGQSLGGVFGILLGMAFMLPILAGFRDTWKALLALAVALVVVFCAGCAALPMPLQPKNEQYNSDMAEGAFIVLAGIDTAQTMHIRSGTKCGYEADPIAAGLYGTREPKPGKVLLVNLAMITVHTMVASWLDDKVAAEDTKMTAGQDNNLGPWYVTRVGFHAVSLLLEGAAVANNFSKGCKL